MDSIVSWALRQQYFTFYIFTFQLITEMILVL